MAGWSPQGQVWLGFSRVYNPPAKYTQSARVNSAPQRNTRSRLVSMPPPAKCTQSARVNNPPAKCTQSAPANTRRAKCAPLLSRYMMDALPHLDKTDLGELHTKTSLGQGCGCARSRAPLSLARPHLPSQTHRWVCQTSASCKSDIPLEFSDFSRVLTK